ncbi:MAG: TonB-dependent receptor [Alphaproteobacteria bacterium]|nr:TonB-dependent receptor [Alphaproteobacteria bacterium]MBU1512510.1 TonB-dependent receptor [Alphaproteobacteria bacterium]MBU2092849.1 TonB-dependent receptor [Alphaproteobacteria bacterium]MBU2149647.1 TonB-dependent receptor [Alphaproteobacteria bacterium]MBU2306859.1 TonB-dependent receptor [Alphaproteobacteria bacterium]
MEVRTTAVLRQLRRALLAGAAIACLGGVAMAQSQTHAYNIPAQAAPEALNRFATQSGLRILFPYEAVAGKRTRPVSGTMSEQAALDQLLADTGLVVVSRQGDVVTLGTPKFQDPAPSAQAPASVGVDEVVVTASRLNRADVPTPLTVLSNEMLREGARPNFIASLMDMPQFKASWSPTITGGSFAAGSFSVDLRGLGNARSLVLVDGRRLAGGYSNGAAGIDLSVIPNVMVDRVDVVTGSASAAWGSNAVAGVVNVVIDNKLEGIRVGGHYGISSRDDVEEKQFEAAGGWRFAGGKGHLIVGGEYLDNDGGRPKTSRENVGRWSAVPNPTFTATNGQQPLIFAPDVGFANASLGGLILSGVNSGRTFNPDGTLRAFDFGRVSGTSSIGGEGPSNDDYGYFSAPYTRYSVMGRATYELSDNLKLTADLLHSRVHNDFGFLLDPNRGDIRITVDNPFLPAAIRAQMVAAGETAFTMGRANRDYAFIENDFSRKTTQGTLALEGKVGETWRWNAYYSHGQFNERNDLGNLRIRANFTNAADAVRSPTTGQPICRVALTNPTTTCVPINLFGEGAPSDAARAYVLGTGQLRLQADLDTGGFTVRGEPFETWAGPVSIALGAEARREEIDQKVGALDLANAFAFSNFAPITGKNTTKEAFGEVLVPLVRDVPGLELLSFNGAARITDDRLGSIWSWKLGFTNKVTDGVQVRFTHSRDIRSPNLVELFSGQVLNLSQISDPQTGTAYQVRAMTGGNPNLRPETSKTTTAGVTLSPPQIPRLTVSADYFDIEIDNAISTISPQVLITLCSQGVQSLCSQIVRGPDGLITTTSATLLNFTRLTTSGLDLSLNYSIPLSNGGRLSLRSSGTWTHEYKSNNGISTIDFLASQGTIGSAGVPKVGVNSAITYDDERLRLSVRSRFISAGKNNVTLAIQNNRIPAYMYFDLGASYKFDVLEDREVEVFANVNNLFDKDPPVSSAFSPYYDIVGTYVVLGARARF